ncbi:MAG: hypothetical protein ACOCQD_02920 [archaeon]
MVKLNEIRTSNLDNLKKLSYLSAARKFPKELMRLLYKMFDDAGFNANQDEKTKTIDRLERDLEDSLSTTNWWLDSHNNRSFEINKYLNINLETKEGIVRIRVNVVLMSEIEFEFTYDDKVGNIFNKLIKFSKDAMDKYKELEANNATDIESRLEARKELRDKYETRKELSFIKSIQRISNKYGFKFLGGGTRPLSYELHYSKHLTDKLEKYFSSEKLLIYINELELRKKIYPILIKKVENSHYLLKDYRTLKNYILIEFSDKQPDQKIAGRTATQQDRHNKIKESMMTDEGYGREVIKQLFGGRNEI